MGLIYLDTCVIIYLVEDHQDFGPILSNKIRSLAGEVLSISPLVKLECMVGPIQSGDRVLHGRYQTFFERCRTVDMPEDVFQEAAVLRAQSGLRTPDALHLACAQHHRCTALWTHDDRLARAGRGLARNILS